MKRIGFLAYLFDIAIHGNAFDVNASTKKATILLIALIIGGGAVKVCDGTMKIAIPFALSHAISVQIPEDRITLAGNTRSRLKVITELPLTGNILSSKKSNWEKSLTHS